MLFYVPELNQNIIKSEEINHFKTMRVKIGEIVEATDLKGTKAKIKILEINKNYLVLKFEILEQKTYSQNTNSKNTVILSLTGDPLAIENKIPTKPSQKILFQAITDKVYLEKLCEIAPLAGITTINLFFSDRSIKQNVQIERLNKILIRACEQSETLFLAKLVVLDKKELAQKILESKPAVLACYLDKEETENLIEGKTPKKTVILNSFQDPLIVETKKSTQVRSGAWVSQGKAFATTREVAAELTEGVHPRQKTLTQTTPTSMLSPLQEGYYTQPNDSCLVGPEGGWSERELAEFKKLDLEFVSLGTTIFPAWLAGFRYFR